MAKDDTIRYYDENRDEFIESTLLADMSFHYEKFLSYIQSGSRILDAGCGTGRDAKSFISRGFEVSAFDGSKEMAMFASTYTGLKVEHEDFLTYTSNEMFDGIWACASLLHIEYQMQLEVLRKYHGFLGEKGVFYMSFKYGDGMFVKEGRQFYCHNEESMKELLLSSNGYSILEMYVTSDVRKERKDDKWLSVILQKD